MATSVIRALQLAALLVLANIAQAAVDPPPAYKQIALPKGVPAEVLYSVALTESKVLLRGEYVPWPWTLNVAGKSYYYATRPAGGEPAAKYRRTVSRHLSQVLGVNLLVTNP